MRCLVSCRRSSILRSIHSGYTITKVNCVLIRLALSLFPLLRCEMLQVVVDRHPMTLEIDSGSPVALIGQDTFHSHWPEQPELHSSPIDLAMWEETPVQILGWFWVSVETPTGSERLPIFVGAANGCNLLGRQWFHALGIRIDSRSQLHSISAPGQGGNNLPPNLRDFECFKPGLGEYRGDPISFSPDPTVKPKFCNARKIPYARKSIVSEEIDRNVQDGVWKGPLTTSEWATGIVPVYKPGKRPRLCGDYRLTVNKAIKPDRYPMPTIEDAFSALSGGTVFSKLDLTQAYTQIPVDDASAKLLTVNTHRGLFSVHRLPFGVSAAPGIFQRIICELLAGIEGTVVWLDDLLVQGKTKEEHDQPLMEIADRISKMGLRANPDKCEFYKDNLDYLGWHLDKDGKEPLRSRVSALLDAPAPQEIGELQSFVGKLNFYDKFLPHRATVCEPLYRLYDEGTAWRWGAKEQEAFDAAKEMLCSGDLLVHYDLDRELVLSCDASPVGLGAVLAHVFDEGERPIEYASRALNAAERNYSQIDKEALSIVFAVKKFHRYLAGRRFAIYTDHKPLLGIFGKESKVPKIVSPRVERWMITLGCYDYDLRFRPGKNHGNADALSRLIVPATAPNAVPEPHGLFLMTGRTSPHLNWQQVAENTAKDAEMQQLMQWVQKGWPTSDPGAKWRPFYKRRMELSVSRGCLLWGIRVIIPPSLQAQALRHLHAAHLGIVKSKRLARVLMWWPGLTGHIENMVATCPACQANRAHAPALPVTPWPEAKGPWQRLHVDFAGPFHGRHFVVLVDSFSGWIDIGWVQGPTTDAAIRFLEKSFRYNGLPLTIVSDNGAAFRSAKFHEFCATRGIRQMFAAPRHPQTNGRGERAVRTAKEKLDAVEGEDWEHKVDIVADALRTTPGEDGKSPNELLMGREIRTMMTLVRPHPEILDRELTQAVRFSPGDKVWYLRYGCKEWQPATVTDLLGSRMARLDVEATRHFDQLRRRADGAGAGATVPGVVLENPLPQRQPQAGPVPNPQPTPTDSNPNAQQPNGLPISNLGRGRARRSRRRAISPNPGGRGRQQPARSSRNPNPQYC